MLDLLETLRRLVVSGHEPAPYLVTLPGYGGLRLALSDDAAPGSLRLRARPAPGGYWLEVDDHAGRRLEQYGRKLPGGRWEFFPEVWRTAPPPARYSGAPSRSSASTAYHLTSGLTA